jgi:DmsE family decaheme c-type cytochrome
MSRVVMGALLALALVGGRNVSGEEAPADAAGEYTGGGVDACTECHDQPAILAILKTRHAVQGDARTPLAHANACETCHGPGAAHAADDETPVPIRFGTEHASGVQDATCLDCHRGGSRIHWSGSEHESHDVPCAACHTIHAADDPMLVRDVRPERIVRGDQSQACYACHPEIRAQVFRMSAHPIKQGRVVCSDCHNPHGSTTDHLLAQETLNETCYECHAEKRGPFLWEHQPARDDCSNCHVPHGSTHAPLLEARGPWLCQQCHMAQFHPSGAYDGSGLPVPSGLAPNRNLLAKNCTNCHSEVHGSNHPSGVRLTR